MILSHFFFFRLRLGRIEPHRLRAVLDNAGLASMNNSQLAALCQVYAHPADPSKLDYVRFVYDLEDVPSFHKSVPNARALTATSSNPLPGSVFAMSSKVLSRLRSATARSRIDVTAFFKAHDRTHNGTCSPHKFGSALTSLGLQLSAAELDALLSRYRESDTAISYARFVADLDATPIPSDENVGDDDHQNVPVPTGPLSRTSQLPPSVFHVPVTVSTDVSAVIRKVHHLARSLRLQIDTANNFFKDSDKLARGVVDETTFRRTVLSTYGLPLTTAEVDVLVKQYAIVDPGVGPAPSSSTAAVPALSKTFASLSSTNKTVYVDYKSFVMDVTIGLGGNVFGIEKDPRREPGLVGPAWKPEDENESKVPSQTEVGMVLARLADITSSRRITLEPMFMDRDSRHSGCVNARQFRSIVSDVPANLTESDWNTLLTGYQRGAAGVAYRAFLRDLADAEIEARERHIAALDTNDAGDRNPYSAHATADLDGGSTTSDGRAPQKRYLAPIGGNVSNVAFTQQMRDAAGPRASLPSGDELAGQRAMLLNKAVALVQSYAAELTRRRLTLRDSFTSFDPMHSGHTTAARFWSVLSSAGLPVTQEDLTALTARYGVRPKAGTEAQMREYIGLSYTKFLDDVKEFV